MVITRDCTRVVLVCVLMSLATLGVAQSIKPEAAHYRPGKYRNAIAKWQIENLKSGVLLVRLPIQRQSILAMYEAGLDEQAENKKKQLDILNQAVMQGFDTSFDFCPVFFFTSDFSTLVKAGEFEKVDFKSQGRSASVLQLLDSVPIFIAEFADLEGDTSSYVSSRDIRRQQEGPTKRMSANSNLGIQALVVKSNAFVQLADPFPYFVRTFDNIDTGNKSPSEVIAKWNRRLHAFYEKRNHLSTKKKKAYR